MVTKNQSNKLEFTPRHSNPDAYRIIFEVNYREWLELRELVQYFGVGNYADAIRLAVSDTLARIDEVEPEIEDADEVQGEDQDADTDEEEPTDEEQTDEEQTDEEEPTHEEQVTEFYNTLTPREKKYFRETVSPRRYSPGKARRIGKRTPGKSKVDNFISSLTGLVNVESEKSVQDATRLSKELPRHSQQSTDLELELYGPLALTNKRTGYLT